MFCGPFLCRRARICAVAEVRKHLGQPARRRARIGSGDKGHFRIGDGGKAVRLVGHAMAGQDRDLGQDADLQTDGNGGLDAGTLTR